MKRKAKMKAKAPTLEDAKSAMACRSGYRWYKYHNGDVTLLAEEHPRWYLWLAGKCPGDWIDHKLVDTCAEKWPGDALEYAPDLLTPERLDAYAKKYSCYALAYAANLLTKTRNE